MNMYLLYYIYIWDPHIENPYCTSPHMENPYIMGIPPTENPYIMGPHTKSPYVAITNGHPKWRIHIESH